MNGAFYGTVIERNTLLHVTGSKKQTCMIRDLAKIFRTKLMHPDGSETYKHVFIVSDNAEKPIRILTKPSLEIYTNATRVSRDLYKSLDTRESWLELSKVPSVLILNAKKLENALKDEKIWLSDISLIVFYEPKSALQNGQFQSLGNQIEKLNKEKPEMKLPRLVCVSTASENWTENEKNLLAKRFKGHWLNANTLIRIKFESVIFELKQNEQKRLDDFVKKTLLADDGRTKWRNGYLKLNVPPTGFRILRKVIEHGHSSMPENLDDMKALIEISQTFGLTEICREAEKVKNHWRSQLQKHLNDIVIPFKVNGQHCYIEKQLLLKKKSVFRRCFFNVLTQVSTDGAYTIEKELDFFEKILVWYEKGYFIPSKTKEEAKRLLRGAEKFENSVLIGLCNEEIQKFETPEREAVEAGEQGLGGGGGSGGGGASGGGHVVDSNPTPARASNLSNSQSGMPEREAVEAGEQGVGGGGGSGGGGASEGNDVVDDHQDHLNQQQQRNLPTSPTNDVDVNAVDVAPSESPGAQTTAAVIADSRENDQLATNATVPAEEEVRGPSVPAAHTPPSNDSSNDQRRRSRSEMMGRSDVPSPITTTRPRGEEREPVTSSHATQNTSLNRNSNKSSRLTLNSNPTPARASNLSNSQSGMTARDRLMRLATAVIRDDSATVAAAEVVHDGSRAQGGSPTVNVPPVATPTLPSNDVPDDHMMTDDNGRRGRSDDPIPNTTTGRSGEEQVAETEERRPSTARSLSRARETTKDQATPASDDAADPAAARAAFLSLSRPTTNANRNGSSSSHGSSTNVPMFQKPKTPRVLDQNMRLERTGSGQSQSLMNASAPGVSKEAPKNRRGAIDMDYDDLGSGGSSSNGSSNNSSATSSCLPAVSDGPNTITQKPSDVAAPRSKSKSNSTTTNQNVPKKAPATVTGSNNKNANAKDIGKASVSKEAPNSRRGGVMDSSGPGSGVSNGSSASSRGLPAVSDGPNTITQKTSVVAAPPSQSKSSSTTKNQNVPKKAAATVTTSKNAKAKDMGKVPGTSSRSVNATGSQNNALSTSQPRSLFSHLSTPPTSSRQVAATGNLPAGPSRTHHARPQFRLVQRAVPRIWCPPMSYPNLPDTPVGVRKSKRVHEVGRVYHIFDQKRRRQG